MSRSCNSGPITLYAKVTRKQKNGGYFRIAHHPTGMPETAVTHVDERIGLKSTIQPCLPDFSHPSTQKDDLGNCWRYTDFGVSDASVSAGRAEPIDKGCL